MIMHVLYAVCYFDFERAFEFATFGQTTLPSLSLYECSDGHSWIQT